MAKVAAFFLTGLLATSTARASDDSIPSEPKHGVFLNLGLYSAVGFGGATYVYAPFRNLVLETGMGIGVSGLQLSFMPKLVLGRSHRFVLGVGPSVGYIKPSKNSLWVNADAGYEFRSDGGFAVGVSVGWTKGLAGCAMDACRPGGAGWGEETDRQAVFSELAVDAEGPQGRVIIGYWF